jgi:hypothetical protein
MLTDDDFTDALLDLDNKITNARQLHKGLQALEADLDDMRGEVTERAASCVFR